MWAVSYERGTPVMFSDKGLGGASYGLRVWVVVRGASATAAEPRGNNLESFHDFYPKARARIWP